MFSRILYSSAAFLFPHNAHSDLTFALQVNQQIQTELEEAAEQGMVSTRSQDNTPASDASQNPKNLYPQDIVHEKKRKIGLEGEESPVQAETKRRRRSAKSKDDSAPSTSANKPGRPREWPSKNLANSDAVNAKFYNESEQEPSTKGSPTSQQSHGIITDRPLNDVKEDEAIELTIKKLNQIRGSDNEALDPHDHVKLNGERATISRRGRKPSKRAKYSEGVIQVDRNGADTGFNGMQPERSFVTTTKATHKRFGSEDIEVPEAIHPSGIEERKGSQEGLLKDEGESGDEAPETVTASAGFDKARSSALEAAKVATRQIAEKKAKRRDHDQRLKLQVKSVTDSRSNDKPSSKNRKSKAVSSGVAEADGQMPVEGLESLGDSPKTSRDEEGNRSARSRTSGKNPLPLLLPEDILAARPVVQAPTPTSSKSKVAISQKRRFLDLESKPPKDIKRGNVTIHVLQDNGSSLPPKSSQVSKALRESWLIGRRGFKGAIGVPRRKPSAGFVRRN